MQELQGRGVASDCCNVDVSIFLNLCLLWLTPGLKEGILEVDQEHGIYK